MSEEEELEETESEDSLTVSEDDELDLDEMDVEEEEVPEEVKEIGAYLVIGQGDFSMTQSNRGADDPGDNTLSCLLYTSPSPRDRSLSRMPSSA